MNAEDAYFFRHALVREAAYSLQMPSERALLHEAAVHALRAALPDELLYAHSGELADHADAALAADPRPDHPLLPLRLKFLYRAVRHAKSCFRVREGLGYALRYLSCVAPPYNDASWMVIREGILQAVESGRHDVVERLVKLAESWHAAEPNLSEFQSCRYIYAMWLITVNRLDEAEVIYRERLELPEASDVDRATSKMNLSLIMSLRPGHRPEELDAIEEEALEIALRAGVHHVAVSAFNNVATRDYEAGRTDQAELSYRQGVEFAQAHGLQDWESTIRSNYGAMLSTLGRLDDAAAMFNGVIEATRQQGRRSQLASALTNLATLHMQTGRLEEAAKLLLECMEICLETDQRRSHCIALGNLGTVRLLEGRDAEARTLLQDAMAAALALDNPRVLAHWQCQTALLELKCGNLEAARACWAAGVESFRTARSTADYESVVRKHNEFTAKHGLPSLVERAGESAGGSGTLTA
jgi:tetratricopeptide (TPR) repeat protein